MLSAYSSYGLPAMQKISQFLRPVFAADAEPAYEIVARYDFDIREGDSSPIFTGGSDSVWDVGTWDLALWAGGNVSQVNPLGSSGMGRYIAYALRGSSSRETTLVAVDSLYTPAGFM